MAISLYDASVRQYLQVLPSVGAILDKGLQFCREKGIDPESLVETRLIEDMLPLRFQVQQSVKHSLGAIEALKTGQFGPGARGETTAGYAALQALVAEAIETLKTMTPEDINARAGADVTFTAGERTMPFEAEGFILTFSLPNFYFHAATAYDILRMKGVPVGKRDFLGMPRLKR
jgi:hypothetical protein